MIKIEKYNLPDLQIINSDKSQIFTWIPDNLYIILGQRDNIERAVKTKFVKKYNAMIMQRPSGGHSVVLTKNTLVVAMTHVSKTIKDIKSTFVFSNSMIIKAFEKQHIQNLEIKGVSDIVLNDMKIAGSSMYFARDRLFFHAVINISEEPEFIAKFLKHPETEPEYRAKRKHNKFITSLYAQGYKIDIKQFQKDINASSIP